MELELFKEIRTGLSMEDKIRGAVESMEPAIRLKTVMDMVGMGLEAGERLNGFVKEAWELVVKEEWWLAGYGSLEEFRAGCGVSGSVDEAIKMSENTEKKKLAFEAGALRAWGCERLTDVLGNELMPEKASKTFLETLRTLALKVSDGRVAKALLTEVRDGRMGQRGARRERYLQVRDLNTALAKLKGGWKAIQEGSLLEPGPESR